MKAPQDFGCMPIGWYLNHSDTPNAVLGAIVNDDWEWHASRDIAAGEEILVDYNVFLEPGEAKEYYY